MHTKEKRQNILQTRQLWNGWKCCFNKPRIKSYLSKSLNKVREECVYVLFYILQHFILKVLTMDSGSKPGHQLSHPGNL